VHRSARLTPADRLLLCQRIEAGTPLAHAAASMGISRDRAYVWWRRTSPKVLPDWRTAQVVRTARRRGPGPAPSAGSSRCDVDAGSGPARIAGIVGLPASTVHAVLVRHQLNRLNHLDRVTRAPIRRIEMSRPGELVTSTSRSSAASSCTRRRRNAWVSLSPWGGWRRRETPPAGRGPAGRAVAVGGSIRSGRP
jgi:leucine-zipper of insertion element IS481